MKNSRHFLFTDFFDPVFFSLHPILHGPHLKTLFSEWTVEYFLFNRLQGFAIDIDSYGGVGGAGRLLLSLSLLNGVCGVVCRVVLAGEVSPFNSPMFIS